MSDNSQNNSEQREHTIRWQNPMHSARAAMTLSGLEFFQAMLRGDVPAAPIAILMNMGMEEVEFGHVVFTGIPQEYHLNPAGGVHGGFAATLLDSALGCAVHSTLDAGMAYGTVQLNVHMVRAIRVDTGELRCEGKIVHSGRRMATAEATLTDTNGKLYAHGTTTCMIFPIK